MQKFFTAVSGIALLFIFIGCSESNDPTVGTGKATIEFDARVGTLNLQLGTGTYKNSLGQDYTVEVFRYYISNIRLTKSDGTKYDDPVSEDGSKGYYLVDEADQSSTFITLEGVPFDQYTGMEFTIGVDASRVSQGAQTGALDPANKLFWSWNSGYIFVQLEGTSPQSTESGHEFMYHVGGYKTDPEIPNLANNIKTRSVSFGGESANITSSTEPQIHLIVDVNKFLEGATTIDFAARATCHSPSCGVDIANNYENTFVFDHLHE